MVGRTGLTQSNRIDALLDQYLLIRTVKSGAKPWQSHARNPPCAVPAEAPAALYRARLPRVRQQARRKHHEAIDLGRKNYRFIRWASGGRIATIAFTLIETAKHGDVDPQAWLAQSLDRIPGYKLTRVHELLL